MLACPTQVSQVTTVQLRGQGLDVTEWATGAHRKCVLVPVLGTQAAGWVLLGWGGGGVTSAMTLATAFHTEILSEDRAATSRAGRTRKNQLLLGGDVPRARPWPPGLVDGHGVVTEQHVPLASMVFSWPTDHLCTVGGWHHRHR